MNRRVEIIISACAMLSLLLLIGSVVMTWAGLDGLSFGFCICSCLALLWAVFIIEYMKR